jgi:membrane protein DedA with SNARE-associated domain
MQTLSSFVISLITSFIAKNAYLSVFVLMTAESALIPIPSEVTMPFAGFLAGRGIVAFWPAVLLGTTGNLLGSIFAYLLGLKMGEAWIRETIKKWGKLLLLKEQDFDKAKNWFVKYGQLVIFFSRLLPVVRTFISLPAGIAGMNFGKFSLLTFGGSLIWSTLLCWMGLKLGQNWQAIEPVFRKFQIIITVGFIGLVAVYLYKHLRKEGGN